MALAVAIASVVINAVVQAFKVLAMRDRFPRKRVEQWLPRIVAVLSGLSIGLAGFLPGSPVEQIAQGVAAAVLSMANWWAAKKARLVKGEGSR